MYSPLYSLSTHYIPRCPHTLLVTAEIPIAISSDTPNTIPSAIPIIAPAVAASGYMMYSLIVLITISYLECIPASSRGMRYHL